MVDMDETTGQKLLAWCDHMDAGGLDRPIAALPFKLMSCNDDEEADMVGLLFAIVAVEGPEKGREGIRARLAGEGPVEVESLDEDAVGRCVVLAHLLSMWSHNLIYPQEPHMTLRKAFVETKDVWKEPVDDDD